MKNTKMKNRCRQTAVILAAILLLLLAGCGETQQETAEPVELNVFAAASMTEALTELGNTYMQEHQDVKLVFNFDSSGTLLTQIEEGAECDIFISAAQQQMDALADRAAESRFDILENKVVLAVPEGNPAGIESYEDLEKGLKAGKVLLAMGNSDVPVGQYTQKILDYMGLSEQALAKAGLITYGGNVKEVTTQISEGMVDCGIIYETDANTAGLTIVDTADAKMCGQVIYPAAFLDTSTQQEAAKAFLEFLQGEEAGKIFAKYGFTPIV